MGIDGYLIKWTRSFLTDRKIQLVIDGHDNKERAIETGIPQGSPVSPILFLIYISGIFDSVSKTSPNIMSLSFVDDLGFIASGYSVKEIAKALEKVAQTVIKWGNSNAVTYDIAKTEAAMFSKSHRQRLNKQIAKTDIKIGAESINFNKEATRWLGIWLDSQLKFTAHVNQKFRAARTAEIQIKGLTRTYGMAPGLVRRVQLAVAQSIALYGVELWWKGQKNYEQTFQKLLNRQARSITGMYPSTPIHPLLSEAGLIPARILLDLRQKRYTYRLLTLSDGHPTKGILPVSMREGDGSSQPGEQPKNTLMWVENARPTLLGQLLAWRLAFDQSMDPADGVEPMEESGLPASFAGDIIIEGKEKAIVEAKRGQKGTVLWTDGSKLDTGNVGAAVTWKDISLNEWKEKSLFLGKNKEVLDGELWAIATALETAKRETRSDLSTPIIVFTDSQEALATIQRPSSRAGSPYLRRLICHRALDLKSNGWLVTLR